MKLKAKNSGDKSNFTKCALAILKMDLISIISSLVLILLIALITRWASLDNTVTLVLTYIAKYVSVFIGAIWGLRKTPNGAINGGIGGMLYMLLSFLLFCGLNGGFANAKFNWIDFVCLSLAGIVAGIIAVNIKKKQK